MDLRYKRCFCEGEPSAGKLFSDALSSSVIMRASVLARWCFSVGLHISWILGCYTVRLRLSEIRTTGNTAIRHKTAKNRFLPMHFTPSIRKPRFPTPTRKFRNWYVKSLEKSH